MVFRSDGHVDYVAGDGHVYSTRNIDFETLKVHSHGKHDMKKKQDRQPWIKNVFIDGNNLLILTDKEKSGNVFKQNNPTSVVYMFNIEKLTISKTKLTASQAFNLPIQY